MPEQVTYPFPGLLDPTGVSAGYLAHSLTAGLVRGFTGQRSTWRNSNKPGAHIYLICTWNQATSESAYWCCSSLPLIQSIWKHIWIILPLALVLLLLDVSPGLVVSGEPTNSPIPQKDWIEPPLLIYSWLLSVLLKGLQPKNERWWDKALTEASLPICAESIITPWLHQPLLMLPLKTLCTPRYTVLYTSGPVSVLFQHSLPSLWAAAPCWGWSPSHDPHPLCQLLVSTPRHMSGSNVHILAESLELTVRADSRSPWGRAHEHGRDGKARGLLCPGCSQHCAAPSRQKHSALRSSLPGAILAAPLTQPPSPHRLPRAAQTQIHTQPCKKLLWCTWLWAQSPLSSWGSPAPLHSGPLWEGARQGLRRWTPWTASQPVHQAALLALSCLSQVQHPSHQIIM